MKEHRNRVRFAIFIPRAVAAFAFVCLALAGRGEAQSRFAQGSSKVFADRVLAAGTGEYARVLAEFDAHLAEQPGDALAAIERCRFIDEFANLEEETIETAYEDSESCKDGLRSGLNVHSGDVKTYLWLDTYSEESIEKGESLLKESGWTPRQLAAIHEGLSDRYQVTDVARAGHHAVKAWGLDSTSSRVLLRAAEHYVRIGSKSDAVSVIATVPAGEWNSWTLEKAVTILLNLGAGKEASALVDSHKDVDLSAAAKVRLAGALLAAGEEKAGRSLIEKATVSDTPEYYGAQLEREMFEFQLRYGTASDAVAAYRKLRDKGFAADAFGRHRLALTAVHWRAWWQLADLAGVFVGLAVLVTLCLLPLVVLLPIHHRSVVKQLRGYVVPPLAQESPWSLRNAWYALAVAFSVGSVALYVFSYSTFESYFGGWLSVPVGLDALPDDRALGQSIFWASVLSLALLLPLARRSAFSALLFGGWTARRSISYGIGVAFLVNFVAGMFNLFRAKSEVGLTLGTETVRSLQGVYSVFGMWGLLVCAAIIVPAVEEFVFRGVLLRSLSRHIRFWGAALLQAVIFTAMHEDTSAFPVLFVFAIATSQLAHRSGGLLSPITMHAVNNAVASLAIIGMTRG